MTNPDLTAHVRHQLLAHLISRQITCPIAGAVLDIRTAVPLLDSDGDPVEALSSEVAARYAPIPNDCRPCATSTGSPCPTDRRPRAQHTRTREDPPMSAYIVHAEHIHVLLEAFMRTGTTGRPDTLSTASSYCLPPGTLIWPLPQGFTPLIGGRPETGGSRRVDRHTADTVGSILHDTNAESVNHRYAEGHDLPRYRYQSPRHRWTPVQVLSAIAGYEYQSCEHPGWPTSEAAAFCDALRRQCINQLPGYTDGPWTITPDSTPTPSQG